MMKLLLKLLSLAGLTLTVLPAILVFAGIIDKEMHFVLMGVGTFLWFGSAPFWMKGPSFDD